MRRLVSAIADSYLTQSREESVDRSNHSSRVLNSLGELCAFTNADSLSPELIKICLSLRITYFMMRANFVLCRLILSKPILYSR